MDHTTATTHAGRNLDGTGSGRLAARGAGSAMLTVADSWHDQRLALHWKPQGALAGSIRVVVSVVAAGVCRGERTVVERLVELTANMARPNIAAKAPNALNGRFTGTSSQDY